jgi:hypothetical protein
MLAARCRVRPVDASKPRMQEVGAKSGAVPRHPRDQERDTVTPLCARLVILWEFGLHCYCFYIMTYARRCRCCTTTAFVTIGGSDSGGQFLIGLPLQFCGNIAEVVISCLPICFSGRRLLCSRPWWTLHAVAPALHPAASEALDRIAALCAVEGETRGRSPDERQQVCHTRARHLL